jgi:predicted ATPase
LARLREAFEALGRRQGSAILMRGEMGIGKSRLVNELLTSATIETRMLIGRSYESERSLAFGPWLDALRSGGVLRDTEALACLTSTSRAALARLLPELGPAEGAGPSPIDARILFEAVDHLIAALANDRPLVLALEDLHWADELSGQLFAFIARRSRSRPVLLVGTARSEDWSESAARPALDEIDRDQLLARMSLGPLSDGPDEHRGRHRTA